MNNKSEVNNIRVYKLILITLTILSILRVLAGSGRSLWLDETISLYFISNNWGELWGKIQLFPQHSILYAIVLSLWHEIFPYNEIFTRLLSLFFGLTSCLLFYKAFSKWQGTQIASLLVSLFVTSPVFYTEASNARPYILGIALISCSFYSLISLMERTTILRFLAFVISTSSIAYANLLFNFFIFIEAALVLYFFRLKISLFIISILTVIVFQIPALSLFIKTLELSDVITVDTSDGPIVTALGYLLMLGMMTIFLLINKIFYNEKNKSNKDLLYFGLICFFTPIIFFNSLAFLTETSINSFRYYSWCYLGICISIVALLCNHKEVFQFAAVTLLFYFSLMLPDFLPREGYRQMFQSIDRIRVANPAIQVITFSGIIEASSKKFREEDVRRNYFLAPFIYYNKYLAKNISLEFDYNSIQLAPTFLEQATDIEDFNQIIDSTKKETIIVLLRNLGASLSPSYGYCDSQVARTILNSLKSKKIILTRAFKESSSGLSVLVFRRFANYDPNSLDNFNNCK